MKNICLAVTFMWLVISGCWSWLALDAVRQMGGNGLHLTIVVGVGMISAVNAFKIASRVTRWISGSADSGHPAL